ncbi:bifunctional 5,10-methylenetetrahydrofolate dehydrogenase/5,10-methenyltetrahydrofolate cyclohydrolase [Patescibacteria group bacterium]|nr:bifunctional 5,10-methylenetetrahydrofolate dehydrogenase/5,10-methenyltetrahydrofolate cyclohydrolase [Patescibacteria group bacterium]
MNIIDGKKIADGILEELKEEIEEKELKPCLGIILVGNNLASQLYVQKKEQATQKVGIEIKKKVLTQNTSEEEILKIINQFNQDNQVNGILVQMPLPEGINSDKIIKAINLEKDVDGFLSESKFDSPFILAIEQALKSIEEDLDDKKTIALVNSEVFGERLEHKLRLCVKSIRAIVWPNVFGHPMAEYDIIITALGKPHIIKGDMVKSGVILIDGGISKKDGKIVGDVDRESVQEKASWLSPVPGGLGPLTVAFLLRNVIGTVIKVGP